MEKVLDCRDCQYCGNDPDGLYCAENHAMKNSNGFGRGIGTARKEECGKSAIFFIKADAKTLAQRGRKP